MTKTLVFFCVLFVLLIPTQFGLHFWPMFSYINGLRVDYLSPTLYALDAISVLIIFLYFLRDPKFVISQLQFLRYNRFFLLFIILISLNIVFSLNAVVSFYRWFKIIEYLLACYVVIKTLSTKQILYSFLLVGTLECVIGAYHFIANESIGGIFYFLGERSLSLAKPEIAKVAIFGSEHLRPYGTFSHPNSLGGFYLLFFFFVLTLKKQLGRNLKLSLLFMSFILIFLSFSKTVALVFSILLFSYFLWNKFRKNLQTNYLRLSAAILTSLVGVGFIFFYTRGDTDSFVNRILLMHSSFEVINNSPLFGVGLGNYILSQNNLGANLGLLQNQPVHNVLLLFLAEFGIITLGLIVWQIKQNWLLIPKKTSFVFLLFCVLLTGQADHYWLTLPQNILLVCFLLTYILIKSNTKEISIEKTVLNELKV